MILKTSIQNFSDSSMGLKGESVTVALGLVIGGFVGVMPTIPFHLAII
jgi:hypothetical protein